MMHDREKAINCLTDIEQIMVCRQEICPREELQYWIELKEGVADALTLLKEQEAVEPKKTAYQRVDHTIAYRYRCGTCDMSIFPSYKYCPFCGQAVKWE